MTVLFAIAFLLPSLPIADPASALPTPGTNVGVSVLPSWVDGASLAVDASGGYHVAWKENVAGRSSAYYSDSSDGITWRTPAFVDPIGWDTWAVSLAVEREGVPSKGRLYYAFEQDAKVWLVTSNDGVAWSAPQRVDRAPLLASSRQPSVAASGGRVTVAWTDFRDPTGPHILGRVSNDAGTTWGPEIVLTDVDTTGLAPAVRSKGDTIVVVCALVSPSGVLSARSDDGGVTWRRSVAARVSKASESITSPDVYLDEAGIEHLAWTHSGYQSIGATWRLWGRVEYAWSADGMAWSAPVRVDDSIPTTDISVGSPSIDGLAGTLWIAWADNRTGTDHVYASWSADGLTWSDGLLNGSDLRVDSGSSAADPTLRTGGFGVYVAWKDFRSDSLGDLYFSALNVSPLVITEVQDEPASAARVEFYNAAKSAFPLARVILVAGSSLVSLASLGSVPARSHLVVGAAAGSDIVTPLNMGTDGASIRIVRGAEVLATAGTGTFGIAPDPLSGESTSRDAGTLDYTAAWTRSPMSSFRARNGVPPPNLGPEIVLNEVLWNALATQDRFVGLSYRGLGTLDLTGYRLVGDVVYTFAGRSASVASRHPTVSNLEAAALFDSLNIGGDNVYLYDPIGRLLDMVGWTTAHTQGRSVTRAVDGVGGTRAYDDGTAVANGWQFDQVPQPRFLELGPPGQGYGDRGATVEFALRGTSHAPSADTVTLLPPTMPTGWSVAFLHPDRTPVTDLGVVNPDASVPFLVEVTIAAAGGPEDGGTVTVEAAFATYPWQASVLLQVGIHPYLLVGRTVSPSTVYVAGSGLPYNEITSVSVSARAAGSAMPILTARDVVFQIDDNATMNSADYNNVRVDAVKAYIEAMRPVDRGAVLGFHILAWSPMLRPALQNATIGGKGNMEGDADSLACSPWCFNPFSDAFSYTNIDAAIQMGNRMLIQNGDPRHARMEILLANGPCWLPGPCTNTTALLAEAAANGIAIYTVGLGPYIDEPLLRNIASATGGKFFHADQTSDLVGIYTQLAYPMDDTAAVDPNPGDGVPMVEDDVPRYMAPQAGSYVDPATGQPRPPGAVVRLADRTLLQWNVPKIAVGETWSVKYDATAARVGTVDVALYPDSRLAYADWSGRWMTLPLPRGTLTVLATPNPPYVTVTLPMDRAADQPLDSPIVAWFDEPMDPASVVWTIRPSAAATAWWPRPNELRLNHTLLQPCMTYTVHITQGRDLQGESLVPSATPNPWSFSTVCVPPEVVRTSPAADDAAVPLDGPVVVTFSAPMDTAATSADLGTFPALTASWDPTQTVLTLAHADPFNECTVYSVTARGRDLNGTALVAGPVPNPWSFTTACPPTYRVTITRNPALGTVLVDEVSYAVPATFLWRSGDSHRIEAPASEPQGSSRLAFLAWDDGGARNHDVVVGGTDRTITASYGLQHPASISLVGLSALHPASVSFTLFGVASSAPASTSWSSWVDAETVVSVPDAIAIEPRERYRTTDASAWTASAPLSVTVTYVRQFLARIALVGTDLEHTVNATWRLDRASRARENVATEWAEWADAGSTVSFDGQTTGTIPRTALDPTSITVDRALDVTIRYSTIVATPPPAANWKPLFSLAYGLLLVALGFAMGDRRDKKGRRLLLPLAFAGFELAIGAASWGTGILRIPDGGSWLSLGFWLNTALLAAGLAVFAVSRGRRLRGRARVRR